MAPDRQGWRGGFVPTSTRRASREEVEEFSDTLENISVSLKRVLPLSEVRVLATENYNTFWCWSDKPADVEIRKAPESFLDRITVNYLRHEVSRYHSALRKASRLGGNASTAKELKRRVLLEILDEYPELHREVYLQLEKAA